MEKSDYKEVRFVVEEFSNFRLDCVLGVVCCLLALVGDKGEYVWTLTELVNVIGGNVRRQNLVNVNIKKTAKFNMAQHQLYQSSTPSENPAGL